jgi:hypothetical protein
MIFGMSALYRSGGFLASPMLAPAEIILEPVRLRAWRRGPWKKRLEWGTLPRKGLWRHISISRRNRTSKMQCRQCGYDIPSGKRFCRQCGTAAPDGGSEAAVTEVEQEPSARWGTSAGREALPSAPPEEFTGIGQTELSSGYKYSADEESDFQSSSDRTSHRGLFVLLAAVLVAGALGWSWFAASSRSSKPITTTSPIPPPGAAAALPSPPAAPSPIPSAPPTSAQRAGLSSQPPAKSGNTKALGGEQKAASNNQPNLPMEPIKPRPSPMHVTVPALPTAGTLHYYGPPVRFGQTVVFAGLPGGRLKFTFDHQSWSPLIARQPDGTQKLTLRSLKQGEQTQCDVGWEIIK